MNDRITTKPGLADWFKKLVRKWRSAPIQPAKLGKYEILGKVGEGAMGVVYKAWDPRIGRLASLKVITTGLPQDPGLRRRFCDRAMEAGVLQHPNIVTIFELFLNCDIPFIAMEYLEGDALEEIVERGTSVPLERKVSYVVQTCRALDYSHKRGVIHRHIKPENVMVTKEGVVKVTDFGIAPVSLIGTPVYMSPQQFRNIPADAQSDIWAVGTMFYELLAGRRPFDGENSAALIMNIVTQDPPDLRETAPGTPPDVIAVVEKMLKKELGERYRSMDEILIELEPIWRRLNQT